MTTGNRSPLPSRLRALVGPVVIASALAACGTHEPQVVTSPPEPILPHESFTLESKILGETRTINVYTPSGYAKDTALRFPVLYMPDGGIGEDFPHVTNTVDELIAAGEMRPVVVVGIENTERRRDMTGPTNVATDREIAPRVGGSAAFRAFLRRELMPEIDRRMRSTDESAIIGESLAGLFVLETFLLEPDAFDSYVAISPSVWWNDEQLVKEAHDRLAARPPIANTLYLTCADEDNIIPGTARIAQEIQSLPAASLEYIHFVHAPRPDQQHGTIYRAAAPATLRIVFAPVIWER